MPEKCSAAPVAVCRITFLSTLYYTCHMNGIFVNYVLCSIGCSLFNDVIINSDLIAARDRIIENVELGSILIQ
jgi:hypothetical protein